MGIIKRFLTETYIKLLRLVANEDHLSHEDKETSEYLLKEREQDNREVEKAIREVLLPSLPQDLKNLESIGSDVTPLNLFLALDALSMLVHRTSRNIRDEVSPIGQVELSKKGAILINGKESVPSSVTIREMAYVGCISDESAIKLLEWWVPSVFKYQSRLLVGIDAVVDDPSENIILKLEERNPDEDLSARWAE